MSARFAELDHRETPLGPLSLRRRLDPTTGEDIHEVKLGDEYLMSSLFTSAEVELARMALAATSGDRLDVVVGGLGLGYTARAVLADPRVRDMVVVDALAPVIEWHEQGLVPLGPDLTGDPRCHLVHGDFFTLTETGYDGDRMFDVVAVDIDHSPRHVLAAQNAAFYTTAGLDRVRAQLRDGGVFALWSNDPPDDVFLDVLRSVFPDGSAHVVRFDNPLQRRDATNTVYVGSRG